MSIINQLLVAGWVTRLGWTLVHSLWALALVTAVIALLLTLLRRSSANVRYGVACVGLGLVVMLPAIIFSVLPDPQSADVPAISAAVRESSPAGIESLAAHSVPTTSTSWTPSASPMADPTVPGDPGTSVRAGTKAKAESPVSFLHQLATAMSPWMPWCAFVWAAGVLAASLWNFGGWIAAQRLKRLGTNPVGEDISRRLSELARRLGIRRHITVLRSLLVEIPAVVGWLRPVILLPAGVLTGLAPTQLDAILAHELAHIRRYDYLVNLLQTVVEILLFYHPGVWWISRQIRVEREHCCDDLAVAACGDKVNYATTLAAIAAGLVAPKMVMAARRRESGTLTRVHRILGGRMDASRRWCGSLAAGLIASVMLGVMVTCLVVAGGETRDASRRLALEVHVVDVDGNSPERCMMTFWEPVAPGAVEVAENDSTASDFSVPQIWRDSVTGKTWQPIGNFGAGDRATKEELAPGEYRVTAGIGHGDPTAIGVSDVIRLDGSREHTTVTLAMEAGPPLTVKILDEEDAEPVECAAFRLVRADGLPVVRWSSGGVWCIQPMEGRHKFTHLAPGDYTLEVFKQAHQYGQKEYPVVKMPVRVRAADDRERNVTVKLKAIELSEEEARRRWPWSVTGQVKDTYGRPLEGVEIRASCGVGTLWPTGTTLSDSKGRYTLRFGPAMRSFNESTGGARATLQAATIFASKPGYTEKNLCRQGGLMMAGELPAEDNAWGAKPGEVVLPNKPHKLDFVMVPSGSLEVYLVDEEGKPIGEARLSVKGKDMYPSTSVLSQGKTDAEGHYRIEGVPTDHTWWIECNGAERSGSLTLPGPGLYRLQVQIAHDKSSNKKVSRIISVTDPQGNEARDRVLRAQLRGKDRATVSNPLGLEDDMLIKIYDAGTIVQRVAFDCESFYSDRKHLPKDFPELATRYVEGSRDGIGVDPFAPGQKLRLVLDENDERRVQVWSVGPDGDWDGGKQIDTTRMPLDGDLGAEIRVGNTDWHWLADSTMRQYIKGERLHHYLAAKGQRFPKPEVKDDGLAWGPVVDGLQLAVELSPKRAYLLGETIDVRFHVRNAADYAIEIALTVPWRQDLSERTVTIHDEHGRGLKGQGTWYSGSVGPKYYTLKPGEKASYDSCDLAFVAPGERPDGGSVGYWVEASPGGYTAQFKQHFPTGMRGKPGEWKGVLVTGPVSIHIGEMPRFSIHRVRGYRKPGRQGGMTRTAIFREDGFQEPFDPKRPDRYPLQNLVINGTPLLTEDDIVAYDWRDHSIRLKPGVGARLYKAVKLRKMYVPFVVQVEGRPIYLGAFRPPSTSDPASVPNISLVELDPSLAEGEGATGNTITIVNRPAPLEGQLLRDPRWDERLKAALQKAEKLLVVNTAVPSMPGSRSSIGDVIKEEGAFAIVCEAVEEPGITTTPSPAIDPYGTFWQEFKVVECLFGEVEKTDSVKLAYRIHGQYREHNRERTIGKGERVIWVGRRRKGRFDKVKALPDAPENRQAVEAAARKSSAIWGSAVDGVQVRLRTDKRSWTVGKTPTLLVDIFNGAEEALFDAIGRHTIHELEVDGVWYLDMDKVEKLPLAIEPGLKHSGLTTTMGDSWSRRDALHKRLKLSPGKHTVRVAFSGTLGDLTELDGGKPVRAVSNPLEIEILPSTPEPKTPEVAVDDQDVVAALQKLPEHGARLKFDEQGWVTEIELSPTWATATELALLKKLPKLHRLVIQRLVCANPPEKVKMTEADLVHLQGLTSLKCLLIMDVPVSDASLAHLTHLSRLESLTVGSKEITATGLEHIKGLTNMKFLHFTHSSITDAGLAKLSPLTKLEFLTVRHSQISDAGLAHLKAFADLRVLDLSRTKVSNAGLAHVAPLDNLRGLTLSRTQVTDAGLTHLKGLTKLSTLSLRGSQITDAGLAHLRGMTHLRTVDFSMTQVTPEGLKELKKALPNVQITPSIETDDRTPPPHEVSWGQAVDGVQVRLWAETRNWNAGSTPTLKVDIRNGAKGELFEMPGRATIYNLEVDGDWYVNMARINKVRQFQIPAGRQHDGLLVPLNREIWLSQDSPLNTLEDLSPGKHTVRVAFVGTRRALSEGDGEKPLRAVSNPVEIEIPAVQDTARNKPAWGEVVDGLQAGLVTDFDHIRIGHDLPLKFLVRNTTDKPITLTHERVPVFINWKNYRRPPGPQLFAPDGNQIFPADGVGGRGLPGSVARTIRPGEVMTVTTLRLPLRPENWTGSTVNLLTYCVKPGRHRLSLSHQFNDQRVENGSRTLTTGILELHVHASDEPIASPNIVWGKYNDGVRCRLSTDRSRLQSGEPPILLVDLQNHHTKRNIEQCWHSLEFKLEVDGEWTGQIRPTAVRGPVAYLTPGQEWINVPLVLQDNQYYMSATSSAPGGPARFSKLFGPGRHTIRVDIEGVVSNPVEIEITSTTPTANKLALP